MKLLLSVIIPVYDDADNLDILLKSIYANTFMNFEVIVVDDASPDSTVWEVARQYPVRYFRHEENRCVAATRNTGAKQAVTDVLVFLDSDVMIEKDTLQRFADAYDDSEIKYYQAINSKIPINSGFGPELLALRWYFLTYKLEKSSVHSPYFSIKKDVFFAHRGFDERFKGLGAEEFELGQRLEKDIVLHTDKTLHIRHNFQDVIPRAISLLKRTTRYSLMFIFRTRRFESETATGREVFISAVAVLSASTFLMAIAAFLFPHVFVALILFTLILMVLYLVINFRFCEFLIREKGLWFAVKSSPAVYIWSLATGCGIVAALCIAPFMVIGGTKYEANPGL